MSPYGLGLSAEIFWALTSREFTALKREWARAQAQILNLQANTEGVPFLPEDFLGGDRAARVEKYKADKAVAELQAEIENFKNMQLKISGADIEGVPAWALGKGKRNGR